MFVFPEDKPVIRGIQSVYVSAPKLIKYYRQQLASGCIHFRGRDDGGVIFFKNKTVIDALCLTEGRIVNGPEAAEKLAGLAEGADFAIDVLEIEPDQIRFWAGIQTATPIYENLSTEFTDLKKLLKKMASQKLTGYIEVTFGAGKETGRIFIVDGKFMGGTYSWTAMRLSRSKQDMEKLVAMSSDAEGLFTVYRVAFDRVRESEQGEQHPPDSVSGLAALEELLRIAADTAAADKKIKKDFNTLLKKQFVELVDKYPFLDPFAGEFEYRNGRITLSAGVDEKTLAAGLLESIRTIMEQWDLNHLFAAEFDAWQKRHAAKLALWGLD